MGLKKLTSSQLFKVGDHSPIYQNVFMTRDIKARVLDKCSNYDIDFNQFVILSIDYLLKRVNDGLSLATIADDIGFDYDKLCPVKTECEMRKYLKEHKSLMEDNYD